MIYQVRRFSKTDNREDASPELLEKAKKEGVIQKVGGDWRIISIKKGKIYYEYLPIKEELSSDFCFEFTPITSRAVALGIATEYLLIKGEYSEAENFNSRYKNALIGCLSPKTNKKIPARKWF